MIKKILFLLLVMLVMSSHEIYAQKQRPGGKPWSITLPGGIIDENVKIQITEGVLTIESDVAEVISIYSSQGTCLLSTVKEVGILEVNIQSFPVGLLIIQGSSGWTREEEIE